MGTKVIGTLEKRVPCRCYRAFPLEDAPTLLAGSELQKKTALARYVATLFEEESQVAREREARGWMIEDYVRLESDKAY